MTIAPSNSLHYEWSAFYRQLVEHPWMVGLLGAAPIMAIFALVPLGFPIESRDIRVIFAVSVVIEGFMTSLVLLGLVRWCDRRENRLLKTFLPRAKTHGGWWFVRGVDLKPTIVHADELEALRDASLLEPLNFCLDEHHEVILMETRRLHELARGADTVAAQHRAHAMRLEGLESELLPA